MQKILKFLHPNVHFCTLEVLRDMYNSCSFSSTASWTKFVTVEGYKFGLLKCIVQIRTDNYCWVKTHSSWKEISERFTTQSATKYWPWPYFTSEYLLGLRLVRVKFLLQVPARYLEFKSWINQKFRVGLAKRSSFI